MPSSNSSDASTRWGGTHDSSTASRVAAIGTATAGALNERGIVADLISRESVSQSLIDGLAEQGSRGDRVFFCPGAEVRPDRLRRGLEGLGAVVREMTLYRTVVPFGRGRTTSRSVGCRG